MRQPDDVAAARIDPAATWARLLRRFPGVAAQFSAARPENRIRCLPRLQHRLARAAGDGWFLLPHTYAFYEPLFSTGMAWSLLAVERLATVIDGTWGDAQAYDVLLCREADRLEELIAITYLTLADFELLAQVSALYFVTVSHAELHQRLVDRRSCDPPPAWQGFLGVDDPVINAAFHTARARLEGLVSNRNLAERRAFAARLRQQLAPRNVIGFAEPERENLYPVDLDLLVERSELLGLSRRQISLALPRLRGQKVCGE